MFLPPLLLLALFHSDPAAEEQLAWTRFRGPAGLGVGPTSSIPDELLPEEATWKVEVPPGYSSPVLTEEAVVLTAAVEEEDGTSTLVTLAIERSSGELLWETEAPEALHEAKRTPNSLVSPTPASDGENVYVFLDTFGVVSYDAAGEERWRTPLGPFSAPYGMGTSPVLADGKLLLQCDHDTGSFLLALSTDTGEEVWRTERPGKTHGFSTPCVYRPAEGSAQVIASGSYETVGYDLGSGEQLWFLPGMAWQAKCAPIVVDDRLYVSSWMAGTSELGIQNAGMPWEEILGGNDDDGDGRLSKEELAPHGYERLWFLFDLDDSGLVDEEEWRYNMRRNEAENGLYAVDLEGARGDISDRVRWSFDRSLPNIPSPLLYEDVLYVLKEGGVLTALDPESGSRLEAGRIGDATGGYYASPVAAGGRILTASHAGEVAVIDAGKQWEVLSVTPFDQEIWGTPALSQDAIYIRTEEARVRGESGVGRAGFLYCFQVGNS